MKAACCPFSPAAWVEGVRFPRKSNDVPCRMGPALGRSGQVQVNVCALDQGTPTGFWAAQRPSASAELSLSPRSRLILRAGHHFDQWFEDWRLKCRVELHRPQLAHARLPDRPSSGRATILGLETHHLIVSFTAKVVPMAKTCAPARQAGRSVPIYLPIVRGKPAYAMLLVQ